MTTTKEYLINNDTEGEAIITEIISGENPIIRLNSTWFHPQGGGQKSDKGMIDKVAVNKVKHSQNNEVDHYVDSIESFKIGQQVSVSVDQEWRLLNGKYHLAGHLIAALVEKNFPELKATKGHHWPNEARVEFVGNFPPVEEVRNVLVKALAEAIQTDLSVRICGEPLTNRFIQIDTFAAVPCGGTHPEHLGVLKEVIITNVKMKKGTMRISYSL